jgi:8-oxo-dGTP diphosphatase
VAVILTNAQNELAAVVARHPDEPAEGGKLALPGGYVEMGQIIKEAAEKEVQEETGFSILAGTLGRFAILDGPESLPGRSNEKNLNIVHVFTAQADQKVQEHDHEVTEVLWLPTDDLPPRDKMAFGHYDVIGMWLRHQEQPFEQLPIWPSEMTPDQLLLPNWSRQRK